MSQGTESEAIESDLKMLNNHGMKWSVATTSEGKIALKQGDKWFSTFASEHDLKEYLSGMAQGFAMGIKPDHYWRKIV